MYGSHWGSLVAVCSYKKSYFLLQVTRLLLLALLLVLHTRNNTDGNKLVIFSGIASYYGVIYSTLTPYLI